jgi:hypothetical protein
LPPLERTGLTASRSLIAPAAQLFEQEAAAAAQLLELTAAAAQLFE